MEETRTPGFRGEIILTSPGPLCSLERYAHAVDFLLCCCPVGFVDLIQPTLLRNVRVERKEERIRRPSYPRTTSGVTFFFHLLLSGGMPLCVARLCGTQRTPHTWCSRKLSQKSHHPSMQGSIYAVAVLPSPWSSKPPAGSATVASPFSLSYPSYH